MKTNIYPKNTRPRLVAAAVCAAVLCAAAPRAMAQSKADNGEVTFFPSPRPTVENPNGSRYGENGIMFRMYAAPWVDARYTSSDPAQPIPEFCVNEKAHRRFITWPDGSITPVHPEQYYLEKMYSTCEGNAYAGVGTDMMEMQVLEVSMPHPRVVTNLDQKDAVNSVFIATDFNNFNEYQKYLNNHGNWAGISKDRIRALAVTAWHQQYVEGNDDNGNTTPFTQHTRIGLTDAWPAWDMENKWRVIEQFPFLANAVKVEATIPDVWTIWSRSSMNNQFYTTEGWVDSVRTTIPELPESYTVEKERPLYSMITATYTNTAPYPVEFDAYEPCVWDGIQTDLKMPASDKDARFPNRAYLLYKGVGFEFQKLWDGGAPLAWIEDRNLLQSYEAIPYNNTADGPPFPGAYGIPDRFTNTTGVYTYPNRHYYTLKLKPGEQRTLTWGFRIVWYQPDIMSEDTEVDGVNYHWGQFGYEHKRNEPPAGATFSNSYNYTLPVVNRTASPMALANVTGGDALYNFVGEVQKTDGIWNTPSKVSNGLAVLGVSPRVIDMRSFKGINYDKIAMKPELTLNLSHGELLGKVQVWTGDKGTNLGEAALLYNYTEGISAGQARISVKDIPYLGNKSGSYQLLIYDTSDQLVAIERFSVASAVEESTEGMSQRIVVSQLESGKFKIYENTFNAYADGYLELISDELAGLSSDVLAKRGETKLLDLVSPLATKDKTTGVWTFNPYATINGVLTAGEEGKMQLKFTEDEVTLEPAEGAPALYRTGDYLQTKWKGPDDRYSGVGAKIAPAGMWKMTLNSGTTYHNSPPNPIKKGTNTEYYPGDDNPDEWPVPAFSIWGDDDFEFYLFGDEPLFGYKSPKLYYDQLSLGATGNIRALMPLSIISSIVDANIELKDIRFNGVQERVDGFRGDFTGSLGLHEPCGVMNAGGEWHVYANTLPETAGKDKVFGAEGGIGLSFIAGLSGEIEFKPFVGAYEGEKDGVAHNDAMYYFLDKAWASIEGPIPIVNELNAGFEGLASSIYMATQGMQGIYQGYGDNLQDTDFPLRIKGGATFGLWQDLLEIGGSLYANPLPVVSGTIGLEKGHASLIGVTILQDVHAELNAYLGWAKTGGEIGDWDIQLPVPQFEGSIGGSLNVMNFLKGNVEGSLSFHFANMNDAYRIGELFNSHGKSFSDNAKLGAGYVKDMIWDAVDFYLAGDVSLTIPEGLPFGGFRVGTVYGQLSKDMASAGFEFHIKAEVHIFGKDYGPNEKISGSIAYNFNKHETTGCFNGDCETILKNSARTLRATVAGTPLSAPMIAKSFTDNSGHERSLRISSSSFLPMAKNKKSGISLLAFSDVWDNVKTQDIQDVSRVFTVLVRSKSNTTGLRISCTEGDLNGLTADRTADFLDWKLSETGDYYLATAVIAIPDDPTCTECADATIAGKWQVEAYNADATAADPAGEIDCDFFYYIEPPKVSNVAYDMSTGALTWDNANLVDDGKAAYRARFELVDRDTTASYQLGATEGWIGTAPQTSFEIKKIGIDSLLRVPDGRYYIRVTLENFDGRTTLLDEPDAKKFEVWSPRSTAYSAVFDYANPLTPAPIPNNFVQVTPANGAFNLSWDAPTDASRLSGYTVKVTGTSSEGEQYVVAQYAISPDTTGLTILASAANDSSSLLNYSTNYSFFVAPFHIPAADSSLRITAAFKPSSPEVVFEPVRPGITEAYRYNAGATTVSDTLIKASGTAVIEPTALSNMRFMLGKGRSLGFKLDNAFDAADISISEEMTRFNATRTAGSRPQFFTFNEYEKLDNGALLKIAYPDTLSNGTYTLQCRLKRTGMHGIDYRDYTISLAIDTIAPRLAAGVPTRSADSTMIVSVATESSATLYVNGVKTTTQSGNLVVDVSSMFTLALVATDAAGNSATLDVHIADMPQMTAGDKTSAVLIDFETLRLLTTNTGFKATARVVRDGDTLALPTAEASHITWKVQSGTALTIDPVTGLITPKTIGTAVITALYDGLLSDNAVVTVADQFPVTDLRVTNTDESREMPVRLAFTEPQGASGKVIETSTAEPQAGIVSTGWTAIAATFDGKGKATLTNPDTIPTRYFRLVVSGGLNDGPSNTTGLIGRTQNEEEPPTGNDDGETHGRASLQVYPNPTRGELIIKNSQLRAGDAIEVFATDGKRIATFTATGEETVINLNSLDTGVYVIRTKGATVKVVKE